MISEIERRMIWDGWFSSEVCMQYFADLSGRYRRWQAVATFGTLLASSGAVTAALAKFPESAQVALAILTACLSFYLVLARNDPKAAGTEDLSYRWGRLAVDYRALWLDQYSDDTRARLDDLEARRAEISRAGIGYPNRQRRIRRLYESVKTSLAYATAPA